MWNGELDDPSERPTSKSRLTPEELHRLPSDDTLKDIAKVVLLDRNRNKVTFKELVNDASHRRTVVVFIRHFFCGMCYGYVRNLSADLMPGKLEAMPTPTRLVIIGCGDPILIPQYIKETDCPFEIYADTSRKLYTQLGFCVNGEANETPPTYVKKYSPPLWLNLLISGKMAAKTMKTSGGLINQNGGEMIWIDGKLKFIHRMRNTTDHVEVEELEQIMKTQDLELSEQADAMLDNADVMSRTSQDTKRSVRSRMSWRRPLSFIKERTGSIFGENRSRKNSIPGDGSGSRKTSVFGDGIDARKASVYGEGAGARRTSSFGLRRPSLFGRSGTKDEQTEVV